MKLCWRKQIWRLQTEKEFLLYKVFNTKYFPLGSVFEARSSRGSFASQSLLKARHVIEKVMKCPHNSLKVEIVLGVSLLNQTLAGPLRRVGNALHIISSGTPCRCIRILKDSKWLSRSFDLSYVSTFGIRSFARKGKEVTWAVKGESVR